MLQRHYFRMAPFRQMTIRSLRYRTPATIRGVPQDRRFLTASTSLMRTRACQCRRFRTALPTQATMHHAMLHASRRYAPSSPDSNPRSPTLHAYTRTVDCCISAVVNCRAFLESLTDDVFTSYETLMASPTTFATTATIHLTALGSTRSVETSPQRPMSDCRVAPTPAPDRTCLADDDPRITRSHAGENPRIPDSVHAALADDDPSISDSVRAALADDDPSTVIPHADVELRVMRSPAGDNPCIPDRVALDSNNVSRIPMSHERDIPCAPTSPLSDGTNLPDDDDLALQRCRFMTAYSSWTTTHARQLRRFRTALPTQAMIRMNPIT